MLPLVDRPAIHWVVEKAMRSGAANVLIVADRRKRAIKDYSDSSICWNHHLKANHKEGALRELDKSTPTSTSSASSNRATWARWSLLIKKQVVDIQWITSRSVIRLGRLHQCSASRIAFRAPPIRLKSLDIQAAIKVF